MPSSERLPKGGHVNGSPGGDRTPKTRRRLEDNRSGYSRPNWESKVYDGWISGGRSMARYADSSDDEFPERDRPPAIPYAELHCHTNYSFKEGASEAWDLLVRAKKLGIHAIAITDHDNLCGAMEFSQMAGEIGIQAIIGVEVTLATPSLSGLGGHHVTLLAETAAGYSNICKLVSKAHMDPEERNQPALDPEYFAAHSEGVICLSGCRHSQISELLLHNDYDAAREVAQQYIEWFGRDNFFLELQQNLVRGDTYCNRQLASLGGELGIGVVATNNVHYHDQSRSRLNDALVAIQHNRSLEETHRERRPNDQFFLKAPETMVALHREHPDAIANTASIAERCTFDLAKDIKKIYKFPDYDAPEGHTAISWLKEICNEAAEYKYANADEATWQRLRERMDEEFQLIEKHNLAGFLLQYNDIIKIAHQVQIDLGIVSADTKIEDHPPGRGRGSSVALVIGYLIGLSHIDPLKFNLKLNRFLPSDANPEDLPALDIDLDFPREIREELILRVHRRKGPEFAALTGMISTYKVRGAIRDLGKALNLPGEDLGKLIKKMDGHAGIKDIAHEMSQLSDYRHRLDADVWRHLVELALQLNKFPKYLAQHPGGMILSAVPLNEVVPMQKSAIEGRFIVQWEKNSAEDAGLVKIDFLALGALSQMTEALQLIRKRSEEPVDLSRIDFDDKEVYEQIHNADTIGIFQIESAAQMQTVVRLRPKNLEEMAWEVGAVRPGVGVNDGVSMLLRRHLGQEDVTYDHDLEEPALERTLGVPLFQDQLAELAVHVAGMTHIEGDRMRRAFTHRNSERLTAQWREKFIQRAMNRGVPLESAEKIFGKFHGLYQFPEAHAYAFGITAFQMSWLKHHHTLEFFVAIFNNQPMGFYNLETLKEDAKRHDIGILPPDINQSQDWASIEGDEMRMGLRHVYGMTEPNAEVVLDSRQKFGKFGSLADFIKRTGVPRKALDNLARSGAFDCFQIRSAEHVGEEARIDAHELRFEPHKKQWKYFNREITNPQAFAETDDLPDRRSLLWEANLRHRPVSEQHVFDVFNKEHVPMLPAETSWEQMMGEYGSMGVHPESHILARLRPSLPSNVIRSNEVSNYEEGDRVTVAGLVIRRQRPSGKATFITLEDEFGHSPLVIWPDVYKRVRLNTVDQLLMATGTVSKREGTLNIVVEDITSINSESPALTTKDWG